ncbi:hypothetical protein HY632_03315 [Candidatus Uhrbacteria bacterium]|nr:hypothetical protein [Candidatus Uhrbacteria bacterium]
MRPVFRAIGCLSLLAFLGAGCITISGTGNRPDGGLFASSNRGDQWVQRGSIPTTTGTPKSLANVDVRMIMQDPQDPKALYVATDGSGAFYTWDGGASWWPLGGPLGQGSVEVVAVHPREKCSIYAAAGQKIFRTTDCARSWQSSDFDFAISAFAIDPLTPSTMYAGNARGDILKSVDGGRGWRAVFRTNNPIVKLLITSSGAAEASSVVYAATRSAGFLRSGDAGATWQEFRTVFDRFPGSLEFRDLVPAPATPGMLFHVSKFGILRSTDGGATWESLTLITAAGVVDIQAFAVNPQQSGELIYATASTFYKSSDGGRVWVSKKLPTARAASALLVDRVDGNLLWLGTRRVKK